MEYSYPVLAFRQQEKSPVLVAFVAHAGEVLAWSGIPRKSDELLTGFQRFLDSERINQEIIPFFQNPANCSPTAIIVALRSDSGLGKCRLAKADIPPGQIVQTTLTVSLDNEALQTEKVFTAALDYVNKRLGPGNAAAAAEAEEAEAEAEEAATEEDEDGEEDEEEPEEEAAHLGSVTVARMKTLLDDKANWSNPDFRAAIADYVKPAFLIDGQHRVVAAAKLGVKGLPFIVCGLFDPPWEEQVFQFTVVNLKPKRIPPALITSIAGLSLTRKEQERVESRLAQAKVGMAEVSIMSLVAYDEDSPFFNMIDMAVGGPQLKDQLLGYGGTKRLAKVWYRAARTSLTLITKQVFRTDSVSRARKLWRDEQIWFRFFCAFWGAVHEYFPRELWKKSTENRLFVGAHLWALQEVLLGAADGQVPSHWNLDAAHEDTDLRAKLLIGKLLEVVTTTLIYFPAEMWTVDWAKGSQDTNAGRAELKQLFEKFVDEGKKAGRVWKNWKKDAWFTKSGT